MRALVVASDVETRSGRQLADAAEIARMQNEKKPSEAEKGHDPRHSSLRMLFDHWLLHRRSLARLGTFGRISELFGFSIVLRDTFGRWATQGQADNVDEVTKHHIAIEIPYSFIVNTGERDAPIELEGERDITIAE